MLGQLAADKKAVHTQGGSNYRWHDPKIPTRVRVTKAGNSEPPARLDAEPKPGIDIAKIWRTAELERQENEEILKKVHAQAYDSVLLLNHDHHLVRSMFDLYDTGLSKDASIANIVLRCLKRFAILTSYETWQAYLSDGDYAATVLADAMEYILTLHAETK
jgi:hypothetical protein